MAELSPVDATPALENDESDLGGKTKSPAVTPQKIRELIDGGIALEESSLEGKDTSTSSEVENGPSQTDKLPFESTSKEAYFSRVETFTSLKWAGKPHELSPLICAKYGWTNVECDMLKCASCQAYLCASLQLAFDFSKYKERCLELRQALSAAHEKFCFWPDSPCPDRFAVLLVDEPLALFNDFLERFQGLCQLELQLPSLRAEDLQSMALTEEKISLLLQLIEEEADCRMEGEELPLKRASDRLQIHIPACILALCGWTSSSSPGSVHLPLISCCRCMRKVGLWSFHQIESAVSETDPPPGLTSTPLTSADKVSTVPTSPRRMITRSQDTTFPVGPEQPEKSPSPVISRMRSWDGSTSSDRPDAEAASPTTRSRPVTRSMGQGDVGGLGMEVPSSPHRRAKRARLCSSSSLDSSARTFFDPTSQHRDWCPWVNTKELEASGVQAEGMPGKAVPGWQAVLRLLLASRQSDAAGDVDPETLSVKSRKVFRIFRQWEATCSF